MCACSFQCFEDHGWVSICKRSLAAMRGFTLNDGWITLMRNVNRHFFRIYDCLWYGLYWWCKNCIQTLHRVRKWHLLIPQLSSNGLKTNIMCKRTEMHPKPRGFQSHNGFLFWGVGEREHRWLYHGILVQHLTKSLGGTIRSANNFNEDKKPKSPKRLSISCSQAWTICLIVCTEWKCWPWLVDCSFNARYEPLFVACSPSLGHHAQNDSWIDLKW